MLKVKRGEEGLLFGSLSTIAWVLGSFLGLLVISAIAGHDQGSWQFWLVSMVLALAVGYGHSRFAQRVTPIVNLLLCGAVALLALGSAFVIEPAMTQGKLAFDSAVAYQQFQHDHADLIFPGATYLGGEPKSSPSGQHVAFRSSVSIRKMLAFYKSRRPRWVVLPVTQSWGTWELRPAKGSREVIRIGDSIESPGKTEVMLSL